MKASIKIFFIISIVSVFLYSCSDDTEVADKFLKMTVEITEDGTSTTTSFYYNNNQIQSSDNPKKHIDYTYENNLISMIVIKDKESQLSVILEYVYNNEKLLSVTSSENYIMNYIHNIDGTVSYEKRIVDSQNQEKKIYHGTLYFENNNLIKDERILDDKASEVISVYKLNFQYDSHKNPFRNILGYDKLLDHGETISFNNYISAIEEATDTYTEDNQVVSSIRLCQNVLKYDNNGYPTEMVYENSISNPNYLKTQYFY